MKYFVISLQTLSDGQVQASILGYDTLESATSAFYQTLASNYIENLDGFSAIVMDQNGTIYKKESHAKPQPIPEEIVREVDEEE